MSSVSAFFDSIAVVFTGIFDIFEKFGIIDLAKGLKTLAGMWK
ncbi:hypothetical protein CDBH8_1985 [Corynebacterium diphtheriae BH8]|nr:hypothetical protein [Corynebacterium diphtheriae]AEX49502.1 hypothetical protein CDBH8_1985 [Corynebacterium diphtheriae BH8]CAB0575744.1 hypothetical protein CIP107533_01991 [Corynebacterium diphtheriae]CAB0615843.1 hypothetical protein CIP107543_01895 [Corynebacterium diphtheriae]CAB0621899.1 hypothetical protein CIP107538_02244 [Corynebacterium diphtheriae]CAB0662814.1 hypothetical protein CIP107573_01933 [Corynebacterium diphtheriae]